MLIPWIKFAVCASLILIFGLRLSKIAEDIVKTGKISAGFMGVLILAAITSFPELCTSIASVTKVNAINLGVGDLIGSVIFNLMIIAILDFKLGQRSILSVVKKDHLITCGFSLLMLGFLIASLSIGLFTAKRIGIFNIGVESPLIFIIYLIGMIYIYKYGQVENTDDISAGQGYLKTYMTFALCGAVIIASGFWLASIGKEIVDMYGWDEMYFGTIVIALATSLPEIVVCVGAVSIGSVDMAVANVLGSNLFNIAVIPIADLVFRKGYLLQHVSPSHIYSCLFAIIMTMIVFVSILYRPKKTYLRFGVGVIMLICTFLITNFFLYTIVSK